MGKEETPLSSISQYIELIKFDAGDRLFCVDVDQVLGVVTLSPGIGQVPPYVPFNNEHLPVYSLDRLLGLEVQAAFPAQEILVLRGQQEKFGIAVDWVGEIYRVPVARTIFRFPESKRSRIKMCGIWGMTNLGGNMTLILEPESLVVNEEQRHTVVRPLPGAAYRTKSPQL
jgi:chemotaxis signal transduction protein